MAHTRTDTACARLSSPRLMMWTVVVALLLSACGGLPDHARDMTPAVARGPGGVVGAPLLDGPRLWAHLPKRTRLLAIDPTGWRALLTDGYRLTVWDGARQRVEQILPGEGYAVLEARFAPGGRRLVLHERESDLRPQNQRIRIVDLERAETLARLAVPGGVLAALAWGDRGQRVVAVLSDASLPGAWVLSWTSSGRSLGGWRLRDQPLRQSDVVRLYDTPEGRASVFLYALEGDGPRAMLGLWDTAQGRALERWSVESHDLGADCAPNTPPCLQAVAFEPEHGRVLVASGAAMGPYQVRGFKVGASAPLWSTRGFGFGPAGWVRLAQDHRAALVGLMVDPTPDAQFGWGGRKVNTRTGDVLTGHSWGRDLPAPPNLSIPSDWAARRMTEHLRHAFGIPAPLELSRWSTGGAQLSADARSGARLISTLHGNWIWRPGALPERLYGATLASANQAYPEPLVGAGDASGGDWEPQEAASGLVVTTTSRLSLRRLEGVWSGDGRRLGVQATEVRAWEPREGALVAAEALGGGRYVALVRAGASKARWVLLRDPSRVPRLTRAGTALEALAWHTTPLDGAHRRWRLVVDQARSSAALVALRKRPGEDAWTPVAYRVELGEDAIAASDAAALGPSAERTLLGTSRASAEVVAFSRQALTWWDLADPDTPARRWEAGEGGWLRAVTPLGRGVVVARVVSQDRPSAEWWFWLDMRSQDGAPRVLGHRRFHDVLAWVAHPATGDLDVFDSRNVLTRVALSAERVPTVARATFLHPGEPLFVDLDASGRVRLPREDPQARAMAQQWLDRGALVPALLDARGRARPF